MKKPKIRNSATESRKRNKTSDRPAFNGTYHGDDDDGDCDDDDVNSER
ncbi:hypothetical protein THAOC_01325, partial [Thalassiosira oceanica]